MTVFEFVDELPAKEVRHRPEGLLEEFAAALKAQPGRWAKWPIELANVNGQTSDIKNGYLKPFRGASFDARSRNGTLYVRCLGEEIADGQE